MPSTQWMGISNPCHITYSFSSSLCTARYISSSLSLSTFGVSSCVLFTGEVHASVIHHFRTSDPRLRYDHRSPAGKYHQWTSASYTASPLLYSELRPGTFILFLHPLPPAFITLILVLCSTSHGQIAPGVHIDILNHLLTPPSRFSPPHHSPHRLKRSRNDGQQLA